MDPYDILQVSPIADLAVIRAAYRSLIQRHHPDRNPGDDKAAQHAVRLTQAYELLADSRRRAAYDAQALAHRSAQLDAAGPKAPALRLTPRSTATIYPKSTGASWLFWGTALLMALFFGWTVRHFVVADTTRDSPEKQLADIRLQFQSPKINEVQRRALLARKQGVLEQHDSLLKADSAMRSEDMAARSLALLLEPLTVSLKPPANLNTADLQLSVPEITLVLGSFDTPKLNDHLLKHRARILQELMQKLSTQATEVALAPNAEDRLRRVVRDSVTASLDLHLNEEYPSTFFESPGRYGVVEVIFPRSFLVLH